MTTTPDRKDVASRLERLERAVRNLERRSTLSSASISGGDLTVRKGGSIRVIDGGNIIGEGGGTIDWQGPATFGGDLDVTGDTEISGNTEISGALDVTGNTEIGGDTTISGELNVTGNTDLTGTTHIGGDLTIDGNTELGGNLTFAPGVVPPEALSYRTEAKTFGNTGSTGPGANTFSLNTTVIVPSWAETTSVIAMSTVHVSGTSDGTRLGVHTAIAGNDGPFTFGIIYVSEQSIPSVHRRDFNPSSSFTVNVSGGLSPVSSTGLIDVATVVMAVFTN